MTDVESFDILAGRVYTCTHKTKALEHIALTPFSFSFHMTIFSDILRLQYQK